MNAMPSALNMNSPTVSFSVGSPLWVPQRFHNDCDRIATGLRPIRSNKGDFSGSCRTTKKNERHSYSSLLFSAYKGGRLKKGDAGRQNEIANEQDRMLLRDPGSTLECSACSKGCH